MNKLIQLTTPCDNIRRSAIKGVLDHKYFIRLSW